MKLPYNTAGGMWSAASTAKHPKRHGNRVSKAERKIEKKAHKEVTLAKVVQGNEHHLRLKRLLSLLERQQGKGGEPAAATACEAADVQQTIGDHEAAVRLLYKALELNPADSSRAHARLAPLLLRLGRTDEAQNLVTHWGTDKGLTMEISRLLLTLATAPMDAKVRFSLLPARAHARRCSRATPHAATRAPANED